MAAYRDETETLRARVAELEREVAALRTNAGSDRSADWDGTPARIFGAPFALVHERVLDTALDDALLEEILDVLRTRFSTVGTVARTTAKGAITWHCGPPAMQRVVEVTIKPDGARTKVRIVERIGQLAGGLFGGIVGGVGGGVGAGVGIPLMIEMHRPFLLLFSLPATVIATWMAVRAGYRATAQRREQNLGEVAAEIGALAVRAAAPKTRVETEDEDEDADDGAEARVSDRSKRRA